MVLTMTRLISNVVELPYGEDKGSRFKAMKTNPTKKQVYEKV